MSEYLVTILDDDGAEHQLYITATDALDASIEAEYDAAARGIRFAGVETVERGDA